MEERGNKTIMCSVLFLDIVEYSKKSVAGQISLKDRFNSYLSAAIRDVPMTDRIILDTGDGAAINFLGDVEDALKAALSLRESLLNEEDVDHPLLVRMGINLGPVRLVRDLNGQPNIVGDGINVAQRVMGFADAAQILVSRSYYDAVSRLSPQYAGMFHYQGSRTDKHVREHEVYAIGYPGDKTTHRRLAVSADPELDEITVAAIMQRARSFWLLAAEKVDGWAESMVHRFQQAEPAQRILYVIAAAAPVLFIVLLANMVRHSAIFTQPSNGTGQIAVNSNPGPVIVPPQVRAASAPEDNVKDATPAPPKPVKKAREKKKVERKTIKRLAEAKLQKSESKAKTNENNASERDSTITTSNAGTKSYIAVSCAEGSDVFVDGIRKGRVGNKPLYVSAPQGKHTVIVSHTSRGIFTQNVDLRSGTTVHIKPSVCN